MRPTSRAVLAALCLACLVAPTLAAQSAADARGLYSAAETRRVAEDWYGAIEGYLAALAKNPSYSEAMVGLAECYYALGEYDQALSYIKKASPLRRGDTALGNLEGFVRIGLEDVEGAKALFAAVQSAKPNDLDARFGLALLDLAAGRKSDARTRLEDSLRISPQNVRALLSLSLIAADQGRQADAEALMEQALRFHGGEARVQYTAARLSAQAGDLDKAIFHARNAVQQDASMSAARLLLASLLYESASYAEAMAIMQEGVAKDRRNSGAWYTLGLAQAAAGRTQDAIYSLRQAVALRDDDEVARLALENLVMDTSPIESLSREPYADWHFDRGRQFESKSYFDAAAAEYRRGLSLNPNSKRGRVLYAELLRKRGLPARQLAQLEFLEGIGAADTSVRDSIETWQSLLQESVSKSWRMDQFSLPKRHCRVAIFYVSGSRSLAGEEGSHTAFTPTALRYLEDFLGVSSRIEILDLPPAVSSPSEAFRKGREGGADYYIIYGASETERDVRLSAEIHVARTGSLAASFNAYRTGNDRLKDSTARLSGLIESAFPVTGLLLKRSQDKALVDLGSQDGLKVGDKLVIVRKGELSILPEGLGPSYAQSSVVGEFTVTALDEEVCEGTVKAAGFYDTINNGDSVLPAPPPAAGPASPAAKVSSGGTASQPLFSTLFEAIRKLR